MHYQSAGWGRALWGWGGNSMCQYLVTNVASRMSHTCPEGDGFGMYTVCRSSEGHLLSLHAEAFSQVLQHHNQMAAFQ